MTEPYSGEWKSDTYRQHAPHPLTHRMWFEHEKIVVHGQSDIGLASAVRSPLHAHQSGNPPNTTLNGH
jgi:hypothetical protein